MKMPARLFKDYWDKVQHKNNKPYKPKFWWLSMKCISCEKETTGSVKFPCPKCSKELMRCDKCRTLSIEYKCPKCEYQGP